MSIDPVLFALLACPIDKEPLLHLPDEGVFYNPRLRRAFLVEEGIPVLLAVRARPVDGPTHERYVRRASSPGARITLRADVSRLLDPRGGQRVP